VDVSVIIPSLNSPILDEVLAALQAQDGFDCVAEVLVVGRDEAGLLGANARARLIDTGKPVNPAVARNIGISQAASPLLVFLDSDCLPRPGWLRAHLAAHRNGSAVVGGSVLPSGTTYWSLGYNLGMFNEYLIYRPSAPRAILPTLNLSVERRVIDGAGLLDETLPRSQDMEWTARMNRAGYPPFFESGAAVEHRHNRTTFRAVWDDCARSGRFSRQVRLRHSDLLDTPGLLRHPRLLRLLSPFIAAAATLRIIVRQPALLRRHLASLPAIYLTKLAWAWGAGEGGPT
jgi:glycosyltransferase involved in cell wall biosynthesis